MDTGGWPSSAIPHLVQRVMHDAELLMWNHIIHSWIDPVFLVLCFAGIGVAICWILLRHG